MSDAMETIVPMLAPGHTAAELEATPKPDELPDAAITTSIPVVDPRAASSGLTVGQVTDFTERLAVIVHGCSEGARGPYAYFVDIEADLDALVKDMRDALEEAAKVPERFVIDPADPRNILDTQTGRYAGFTLWSTALEALDLMRTGTDPTFWGWTEVAS